MTLDEQSEPRGQSKRDLIAGLRESEGGNVTPIEELS